jgi:hypothetical protein
VLGFACGVTEEGERAKGKAIGASSGAQGQGGGVPQRGVEEELWHGIAVVGGRTFPTLEIKEE